MNPEKTVDRGVLLLELLSCMAICEDTMLSDEDADWLDEQVERGMLGRESLPPDVLTHLEHLAQSVDATEHLMRRLAHRTG